MSPSLYPLGEQKDQENSPEFDASKAFTKEASDKEALYIGGAAVLALAVFSASVGLMKLTLDNESFECGIHLLAKGNSIYSQDGNDPCANLNTITVEDGTVYTTEPDI